MSKQNIETASFVGEKTDKFGKKSIKTASVHIESYDYLLVYTRYRVYAKISNKLEVEKKGIKTLTEARKFFDIYRKRVMKKL